MSRATRTIAVAVLLGLASPEFADRAWACIERVVVQPTGRITSDIPVALEIRITTPTSPGHLGQPTALSIVGFDIHVDLYAEGGLNQSPDQFVETVKLGLLTAGTYSYEVQQHATQFCAAFTESGIFCIDKDGCSGSSCTCPLFLPSYNIIDLGTLGGGSSVALGVNDKGQVVGSADTPQGLRHAYLWENGVMIDLGTLGFPAAQSEAWDINNQGVVVGIVGGGDINTSFIWQNGVQTVLGPPNVPKSAYGINDAKQVVGIFVVPPPAPAGQHAFLWENGTMTDLGTLGGTRSIAWDINIYLTRPRITLCQTSESGGS